MPLQHTSTAGRLSALARIAHDPARLLTVRQYWTEFDEPIDLLEYPEQTFGLDAVDLIKMCRKHGVPYRGGVGDPEFPVWLLRIFYPV